MYIIATVNCHHLITSLDPHVNLLWFSGVITYSWCSRLPGVQWCLPQLLLHLASPHLAPHLHRGLPAPVSPPPPGPATGTQRSLSFLGQQLLLPREGGGLLLEILRTEETGEHENCTT